MPMQKPTKPVSNPSQLSDRMTLSEAAHAIGVSVDTLRRWDRTGRIKTTRDARGYRLVRRAEVERLTGRRTHHTGSPLSARNRFDGTVQSVELGDVMAVVELAAGPFRVVAAITRDAAEELQLGPGVQATATVKATDVMIELATREDPE